MASSLPRLFARATAGEAVRIAGILRRETVGGALLVAAAVIALVWINSPVGDAYVDLRDTEVGPGWLHLDLSLGTWAADGLLAIFFFVAGLELKREFVAGDLRDPRRATLPIVAAVGGVAFPALVYLAVNVGGGGDASGWAIPAATDIAFALAVLAVIGRNLPTALRTFLLTLAVVDDLLAITIIALFYTDELQPLALAGSAVPLGLFALLVQRQIRSPWLLLPLALATWTLVHESGVHATVAGVLLAFTVPVIRADAAGGTHSGPGLAERFEHRLRPLSAGVAVPIFALLSAGVAIDSAGALAAALRDPVTLGVIAGLVIGKALGILGSAALVARFTHARLDEDLGWWDVFGLSLLSGVGFTVSLLIGELAFGAGSTQDDHVKIGVLTGSLAAILLAAIVLRIRNRVHGDDRPDATERSGTSGPDPAHAQHESRDAPAVARALGRPPASAASPLVGCRRVIRQCGARLVDIKARCQDDAVRSPASAARPVRPMATRRWRGAGDEGAAGVAAPAIALGAWILLTTAMFSGTVLAAFALARTAGRTQLEATVMHRAKLREVHALR